MADCFYMPNAVELVLLALKSCQHIASNCIDCPMSNSDWFNAHSHGCEIVLHDIAADAIEQLMQENAKLKEALEKSEIIVSYVKNRLDGMIEKIGADGKVRDDND